MAHLHIYGLRNLLDMSPVADVQPVITLSVCLVQCHKEYHDMLPCEGFFSYSSFSLCAVAILYFCPLLVVPMLHKK